MYCFGSPSVFYNFLKNYLPHILCLNVTQMNLEILWKNQRMWPHWDCTSVQDSLAWPQPSVADAACPLLGRGKCPLLILQRVSIFPYFLYLHTFHRHLRLYSYFGSFLKYVLKYGKHTHLHVPLE